MSIYGGGQAKNRFLASKSQTKGAYTNSNSTLARDNQKIRFPKPDDQKVPLTSRELKDKKESLKAAAKLKRDALNHERKIY